MKLRVFDKNKNLKKVGYIVLKGSKATGKFTVCSNKEDKNQTLFKENTNSTIRDVTNSFECKDENITFSSIGGKSIDAWNFQGANALTIAGWVEDDKYSNLKKMLEKIGYKESDYTDGDYVIIEPFVEITCNGKIVYGTITGLLATNNAMSNSVYVTNRCDSSTNLRQALSRIAVAFRVDNSVKCLTGASRGTILGTYDNYMDLPFKGCGYNKYNISDIIDKGKLTITKKYKPYKKDLSATFNFYKDSNCTGTVSKTITIKATKEAGDSTTVELDPGTYYLKEIHGTGTHSIRYSPYNSDGTSFTQCQKITIKNGDSKKITVVNKPNIAIKIKKVDDNNKLLSGAKLKLLRLDDGKWTTSKGEWTTTAKNNPLTINGGTIGKTYKLTETKAPTGYFIATDVLFTLPNNLDQYEWNSSLKKYVYTVTMKDEKMATIKVTKVNSSGKAITSGQATFKLYYDSSCTKPYNEKTVYKTSKANGILTVNNLHDGDVLYVKETEAPTGYRIKDGEKCLRVVAKTVWKDSEIPKIENLSECEYDFDALKNKNDMLERIELYKKYSNFNGLLNLSNNTHDTACKHVTCDTTPKVGCLSLNYGTDTFDESNLSCYNRTFTSSKTGAISGYCKVKLVLEPVGFNQGFNGNFGSVKSGQLYLKREESNKIISKGTLTKTCYTFGAGANDPIGFDNSNNYINEFTLGGNELDKEVVDEKSNSNKVGNLTKREFQKTYNYSLRELFSKKGTGQIVKDNNAKSLGYGLASKFSDNSNKINVKFSITISEGSRLPSESTCYYKATPEILSPNPWKFNLAYRQISKSDPFPSIDGSGRKIGSNWCTENKKCNIEDSLAKIYITDRNDSYNSEGDIHPKYVINLNSASMAEINSKYTQEYDDFGTNCGEKNGTCASDFIEWMKNNGYMTEN